MTKIHQGYTIVRSSFLFICSSMYEKNADAWKVFFFLLSCSISVHLYFANISSFQALGPTFWLSVKHSLRPVFNVQGSVKKTFQQLIAVGVADYSSFHSDLTPF